MKTGEFPGINIQYPWAELILSGKKTIETRTYALPKHYINQELVIIETPGRVGVFRRRAVGIVIFGKSFPYPDAEAFYADSVRHLIDSKDSPFSWPKKKGARKWGWPVERVSRFREPKELPKSFKTGIAFSKLVTFADSRF